MQLFQHQIEGISRMLEVPSEIGSKGVILADDMGLGKTRQAIIAAYEKCCEIKDVDDNPKGSLILIICPATLKFNWEIEINKVYEDANVIIANPKSFKIKVLKDRVNWAICNYDLLEKFKMGLELFSFDVILVDESHYIKNGKKKKNIVTQEYYYDVKRTDNTIRLCNSCDNVFLLTGTPFTSRPLDGWNQLVAINHPLTQEMSYANYVKTYCEDKSSYGTNNKGAINLYDLHTKLGPAVIRRLKEDVLDLPEKMRIQIPVEVDLSYYLELEREFLKDCGDSSKSIGWIAKMKANTGLIKASHSCELIEDIVVQNEKSCIVFSNYKTALDIMQKFCEENNIPWVRIDGSTSQIKRQENVEKFQSSDVPMVFLGNTIAAGVGITLTKATHVVINDLDWVPGNLSQAEDRCYRIGQKNAVTIHYLLAKGTMDMDIAGLLVDKINNIETILTGTDALNSEDSVMKSMAKALIHRKGFKRQCFDPSDIEIEGWEELECLAQDDVEIEVV